MKKIVMVLLLLASSLQANFFHESDKQLHMGFSLFVGMGGNAFAHNTLNMTEAESFWFGVGSALLVGAVKEALDKKNGGKFDGRDMLADGLGGAVGSAGMWTIYTW